MNRYILCVLLMFIFLPIHAGEIPEVQLEDQQDDQALCVQQRAQQCIAVCKTTAEADCVQLCEKTAKNECRQAGE